MELPKGLDDLEPEQFLGLDFGQNLDHAFVAALARALETKPHLLIQAAERRLGA